MEQDAFEVFTRAHRVFIRGIRNGISERLKAAYGDDWWERGVLSTIGENQRENLEREHEKGIPKDMSQLLDSPHFARIVERHHAVAFADAFTSIDYTLALFRYLSAKRNEWAHVRDGGWTAPDIMQAVQAMREILTSLRRKEALEIHRMFQESLDQHGSLPEEVLNVQQESDPLSDEDIHPFPADDTLTGFWHALESYLVVESIVRPGNDDDRGSGLINVQVRVTNTAPVSEGRPNIRFSYVRLEVSGAENHRNRREGNRSEWNGQNPGQTVTSEFAFAEKGLASVEFTVSGEVDRHSLFKVQRRHALPEEVVGPLIDQLSRQFEEVDIEEGLAKVVETVLRIQPALTLAEVSALRRELSEYKPLICGKRETLGQIFEEYHLSRESLLGSALREVILLLADLENNKITQMENAISNTDLESIGSIAHDIEQLQISALRIRDAIRERMTVRNS